MSITSLRPRRRILTGVTALALLAGVVAAGTQVGRSTASAGPVPSVAGMPLAAAIAVSTPTGPVPAGREVDLTLTLRTRGVARLDATILAGRRLTPGGYERTYAASPAAVRRAVTVLRGDGLRVGEPAGEAVLTVRGPAHAVEVAFGVRLVGYRSPAGTTFFAPSGGAHPSAAVARVVASVVGLDNHARDRSAVLTSDPSFNGYAPGQVLDFYDFAPLRKAGLDGAGQTVVFIEIDQFAQSDLDQYASRFGLPPFQVAVHTSPSFGSPEGVGGEADLDLEVVHATAPAAKLVVYYAGASQSDLVAAYSALLSANPHAIVSDSIGGCEQGGSAFSLALDPLLRRFAATGGTLFNASGDAGAFNCAHYLTVAQWNPSQLTPNVSSPADDPWVTAVGGTSIFPSAGGTYGRETAWGDPIEQWGSGGGLSPFFKRPSYQVGPGVSNHYSNGMRQVPDVSAIADINTGWDIDVKGQFQIIGGTSSAAPMWAGLAALADQSLEAHGRQTIGFVNPALYAFAAHPGRYPAPAFHDVTVGNNLYYPATPGWDYTTGLGTPLAANLVDDLLSYEPKR